MDISAFKRDFTYYSAPSPIESISGIWLFEKVPGWRDHCLSTPDHLFHLVIEGTYHLKVNDREYHIKPGNLIYYHASEYMEWIGTDEMVRFYSIAFKAPSLPPMPMSARVTRANAAIKRQFKDIYTLSHDISKRFRLFAAVMTLLATLDENGLYHLGDSALRDEQNAWWEIEMVVKQNNHYKPSLDELCEFGNVSISTLGRICKKATGHAPIQRLKIIRMEAAKGLLLFSPLTIGTIAEHLSYPRIHEFSREFSQYFGIAPRQFRKQAGDSAT